MRRITFLEQARAEGKNAASQIIELPAKDAELYQEVRRMHCAAEKGSHACVGKVSIDAGGVLLQCVRCGSLRGKNPKEAAGG